MEKHFQDHFLLVVFVLISVLTFFIFKPFIYILILAAIVAVIFEPYNKKLLYYTKGNKGLSALLTTLSIVILILAPLIFLGSQIFLEAKDLFVSLANGEGKDTLLHIFKKLNSTAQSFAPSSINFSLDVDQITKQGLSWLLQNLGSVFSNFAKIFTSLFIFLISLYYLLKDGEGIKKKLVFFSPLVDSDDEEVSKKLEQAINSVVKGNLTIALIQGMLVSLGFLIFGVPNPLLWGTVATIAALIPAVGTAMVIVPGIIFLFLKESIPGAIGLLIWGALAVGLIDNFLAPQLISKGIKLHPLLVFLSVIGGIIFFGPVGFILGPLTMSLLFVIVDIYFAEKLT